MFTLKRNLTTALSCTKLFDQSGDYKKTSKSSHCRVTFQLLAVYKGVGSFRCLHIHLRGHTGEKPYNCLQCPKSFVSSSNMDNYLKVHTGDTLVNCSHCKMYFICSGNLRKHVRVHTVTNTSVLIVQSHFVS
jgi:KRAB domain-containing zinc finger protein